MPTQRLVGWLRQQPVLAQSEGFDTCTPSLDLAAVAVGAPLRRISATGASYGVTQFGEAKWLLGGLDSPDCGFGPLASQLRGTVRGTKTLNFGCPHASVSGLSRHP